VPTSSTIVQLSIGDALAIATMKYKKFGKSDFKKFHPSGSLGTKLKTVEDLMITGKKIPIVNENLKMKNALNIITNRKLGVLIVKNLKGSTTGIITDGQIRRENQKNKDLQGLTVKKVMTLNPVSVDADMLAAKALFLMNLKKITSLCVHNKKNKKKQSVLYTFIIFLRQILHNK
jgi:arabinose-5-phosphate isomerase